MVLEKLLNVNEVCDLLGVPKTTLYYWKYSKKIPGVKMGKRLMFHPDDIKLFIYANRN